MIDILFEDKDILVCVKPSGLLSESGGGAERSLPDALEAQIFSESRRVRLFAVHRLDREVSGVMVFAKNQAAAAELSRQVSDRSFEKIYLAVVEGVPERESDTLTDLLFKDSRKNKSFVVNRKRAGVKEASLYYETLSSKEGHALLRILLHTGRTHQIRVQFASRKMPVLGDGKYGSSVRSASIALASCEINFKHPTTHESLCFTYMPSGEMWS